MGGVRGGAKFGWIPCVQEPKAAAIDTGIWERGEEEGFREWGDASGVECKLEGDATVHY